LSDWSQYIVKISIEFLAPDPQENFTVLTIWRDIFFLKRHRVSEIQQ